VKKRRLQQARLLPREGGKHIDNPWLQTAFARLLSNSGQPLYPLVTVTVTDLPQTRFSSLQLPNSANPFDWTSAQRAREDSGPMPPLHPVGTGALRAFVAADSEPWRVRIVRIHFL